MGRIENGYYEQSSFADLRVSNPHFNVVSTYNLLLRLDRQGDKVGFKESLFQDFFTAIAEDVLTEGEVALAFFRDESSRDGWKLTHPSYQHSADIVDITLNGAKKRRDDGQDWSRQYWEILASRKLRQWWKEAEGGEVFVWQLPADTGGVCGYDPVSLTYVYRVVEEDGDKRVEGKYYKTSLSLVGNNKLRQELEVRGEVTEAALIANPVRIGVGEIDRVRAKIKAVEAEGGENVVGELVDDRGKLTPEAFKAYEGQIAQAVEFLDQVVVEEYNAWGAALGQQGVDRLEVAYSFARRAVENFGKTGVVVEATTIMNDFRTQLVMREELIRQKVKWGEISEQTRIRAYVWEQEVAGRYGLLDSMAVGGRGCPGGVMVGLGLGVGAPALSDMGRVGYLGGRERDGFDCPNCGAHLPQGNGDTCGHCGMTKDRWAAISGTKCD